MPSLHAACPHPLLGSTAAKRGHGSTCISGVSAIGDKYLLIAALNSPVSPTHNTLGVKPACRRPAAGRLAGRAGRLAGWLAGRLGRQAGRQGRQAERWRRIPTPRM